jgi:hypothetical protein
MLEGEGNKETSLHLLFGRSSAYFFGICKSQHAIDVKAQHERHERQKITKSVKEIHAHLNLQPPSSPIASEGEKAQRLSPLKKELLDLKMRLQCCSGMEMQASVVLVLTTVAWPVHPPLTHLLSIPLLRPKHMMMMKKKRKAMKKMTMMSEASRRPPQHFLVVKALLCSVLSRKIGLFDFV